MRSQRAESVVVVVVGGFWWAQPPWSGQWCQQELGWVGQVGWQHKVLGSRDGWRRYDSGKFWGNRFCCHGGGGWLVHGLLLLKTMSVGTQARDSWPGRNRGLLLIDRGTERSEGGSPTNVAASPSIPWKARLEGARVMALLGDEGGSSLAQQLESRQLVTRSLATTLS